jgi:sodium/pantothenate symporter
MSESNSALITFVIYMLGVFLLAILSERVARGKDFVGEYFLGSRGFGVWAFALTFAATNASGGSFMGFPALIYTHGWSLALWIAGYMTLPLISMGLIGKRLNQVARQTNAVTIPEIMGSRFASPAVTLVATLMLIFFMFFYLLAQFKAGGKILSTLLSDEPAFQVAAAWVTRATSDLPLLNQASGDYLLCLLGFSIVVIVYVVYGGFRAVVWTDVMQGIVMLVGVVLMLGLAVYQVGGLERATRQMALMTPPIPSDAVVRLAEPSATDLSLPKGSWIKQAGEAYRTAEIVIIPRGEQDSPPVKVLQITTPFEVEKIHSDPQVATVQTQLGLAIEIISERPYRHGHGQTGVYVSLPGPSETSDFGFLAIGTAISFFIFWPFGATGQPANMVRLMSFKDSRTLRYSVVTVSVYYAVIYMALVVIFCCGRVLMPGMEIDPDRTMPNLATLLTREAGMPWLAGLLVAAPFAAVMSSVDSFLLLVSSSVVRDIYQQYVDRKAPERTLRLLSYGVTLVIGVAAVVLVIHPPLYLQDLIVFASGGLAACFLVPILLTLYWPRMTAAGAIAGMLGGALMHMGLTAWGYWQFGEFRAYEFAGLNPFIWDLGLSALVAVCISRLQPPSQPI